MTRNVRSALLMLLGLVGLYLAHVLNDSTMSILAAATFVFGALSIDDDPRQDHTEKTWL